VNLQFPKLYGSYSCSVTYDRGTKSIDIVLDVVPAPTSSIAVPQGGSTSEMLRWVSAVLHLPGPFALFDFGTADPASPFTQLATDLATTLELRLSRVRVAVDDPEHWQYAGEVFERVRESM